MYERMCIFASWRRQISKASRFFEFSLWFLFCNIVSTRSQNAKRKHTKNTTINFFYFFLVFAIFFIILFYPLCLVVRINRNIYPKYVGELAFTMLFFLM